MIGFLSSYSSMMYNAVVVQSSQMNRLYSRSTGVFICGDGSAVLDVDEYMAGRGRGYD